MRIKQGPVMHQGQFSATVEQHRMWRYVIKQAGSDVVLYDGWSGDPEEALETADCQLSFLCETDPKLPKAS
jgi:hypothetical protein